MSQKFSSTEFQKLLAELYSLQRLGIKVGLEHTFRLLDICGNPQHNFPSIHIAGTNGKGSTAAMIAKVSGSAGYKTGLYTSPHLINFNERIRVNGIPISNEDIVEFYAQYKAVINEIESTFFETTTAMAFSYFAKNNVDIAVVETGLGGRLDSTNVLQPKVTVITSITSDHTEILGAELEEIAFEKAGIIKDNIPVILAPQSENVRKVILNIVKERSAPITEIDNHNLIINNIDETGTKFTWHGDTFHTGLIGAHQAINAVLAIEAARTFDNSICMNSTSNGLERIVWPGRLQKLHDELPIFYDVAHNANGIQVVLDTLQHIYSKKPLGVIALKADKELSNIIPILKDRFSKLIVTGIPNEDLLPAEDLYQSLVKYGIGVDLVPDITKAQMLVVENTTGIMPAIIIGSHYIGEEIFKYFDFSFDNGVI